MPSLVKGEMLSPEKIRTTTGGIAFLPHPFRFSDTSVNNPSIVGSASHCNRSSPLHKGAKGDSALPTLPKPHYPLLCIITLAFRNANICMCLFRIRTIPLAFRRVSVCVCLVGFASIAIVVVCGRCVLHRFFATTCKHPCLKPLGTHA